MLHDEGAAGAQEGGGAGDGGAREPQPILSPSIDGQARVVPLGLEVLDRVGGHVRRVGDDDVDPPVQLVQHPRVGGVAADHLHPPGGQAFAALPSQSHGRLIDLDGDQARPGDLVGDCRRDRPRTRAQVDHERGAVVGHPLCGLDGGSRHHLSLGPHDEHPGPARQLQAPEPHDAQNALERLAGSTTRNERAVGGGEGGAGAVGQKQRATQQVLGEQPGVVLGRGDARGRKTRCGGPHLAAQRVAVKVSHGAHGALDRS